MHAVLETDIGSRTSQPGDRFTVRLLEPLLVGKREVLPAGTVFQGKVIAALAGDSKTHTRAEVRTAFNEVLLPDGRSFPVSASPEEQRNSEFDTRPPVGGVLFGAGAVRWDDFRWKKGRTGWLRLRFDLGVPPSFVGSKAASEKLEKR